MRACRKLNHAHDEEDLVDNDKCQNNFWYLYPDINFVIDGTKWDFFHERKTTVLWHCYHYHG